MHVNVAISMSQLKLVTKCFVTFTFYCGMLFGEKKQWIGIEDSSFETIKSLPQRS